MGKSHILVVPGRVEGREASYWRTTIVQKKELGEVETQFYDPASLAGLSLASTTRKCLELASLVARTGEKKSMKNGHLNSYHRSRSLILNSSPKSSSANGMTLSTNNIILIIFFSSYCIK